ncbi:unnamed protein product [Brassica oleracea var. botrytis]
MRFFNPVRSLIISFVVRSKRKRGTCSLPRRSLIISLATTKSRWIMHQRYNNAQTRFHLSRFLIGFLGLQEIDRVGVLVG